MKQWRINNNKALPVIGREGLLGCETLRIPHCLDSRLIDGGEVISLRRRPHMNSPETLFLILVLEMIRLIDKMCSLHRVSNSLPTGL
jgi:hypothetical protein